MGESAGRPWRYICAIQGENENIYAILFIIAISLVDGLRLSEILFSYLKFYSC